MRKVPASHCDLITVCLFVKRIRTEKKREFFWIELRWGYLQKRSLTNIDQRPNKS